MFIKRITILNLYISSFESFPSLSTAVSESPCRFYQKNAPTLCISQEPVQHVQMFVIFHRCIQYYQYHEY